MDIHIYIHIIAAAIIVIIITMIVITKNITFGCVGDVYIYTYYIPVYHYIPIFGYSNGNIGVHGL